ncbi:MAG: hypothetical protein HZA53_02460 [Planctomycetes bacterium]|nr:hypothetical protein [Planctomycetota bacterium]
MAKTKIEPKPRVRRSEELRIAELEARIAELKLKAERKKAKKNPTLRHVSVALRSVDKALAAADDSATKNALNECRAGLSAVLSLYGVSTRGDRGSITPRGRRSDGVSADQLLEHVSKHPGQRGEEIAAALGTDTTTMRPVMHRLIGDKKVKTTGQRRGMQYYPV